MVKRSLDHDGMLQSSVARRQVLVPGNMTSWHIKDLMPSTRYTFNISARYDSGWGPEYALDVHTSDG